MSIAVVRSRAMLGIESPEVTVEVHLSGGLPRFTIVGLPETAVKESRDRVRSAVITSGYGFPQQRVTVNLAPADLPKEGGRYDLAIAIGVLAASGQLPTAALEHIELLGELALTGALRPVRGILPGSLKCRDAGRSLVVSRENAAEAAIARDACVLPAHHLLQVSAHISGAEALTPFVAPLMVPVVTTPADPRAATGPDLADVLGQAQAKRVLEIAAAGGHHVVLVGPPGTGKSMLAQRLPGILPPLEENEALESAAVRSLALGGFEPSSWRTRPFRAPHHTCSGIALVGGGRRPRPGEISLAHQGVLFLDELPEFDRHALEVLREPLETGRVVISRAARQAEFPARFQLVAAMNPCPCGHLGDGTGRCRCSPDRVDRYRARISGPLLDRIDLHVEVAREATPACARGPTSAAVRARVQAARQIQLARDGAPAAELTPPMVERSCALDDDGASLLQAAVAKLALSQRSRQRVMRVARTCADLEGAAMVREQHLAEALAYRCLDRPVGG